MAAADAKPTRAGALDGVRVLDLSRVLSGPFCTAMLGDHGADVVKVEAPTGDDTRRFGPPFVDGVSTYFLSCNRNKRSIALNLKDEADHALLLRLADKADVVVENFRPGTAERLGVGPDVLCARNPQLIYARISGFGQTGPWSHKPGYDLAVQGLSGLMAITGDPDGPPYKLGVSIADLTTGLMAVQAILAALFRRERTGEGDVLDIAMLDSVASLLTFQAQRALTADEPPRRMGNAHPAIAPYESVRTADGWLNLAVGNDTLWARFCDALDQPGWAADPRFATNADRVSHRPALLAAIEGVFAEHPRAHWQALLEGSGVPCGMILEVEEVLALPSLRERGAVGQVLHPLLGALELLGHPVRFANAATRLSPPPELNAHRDEVLADWGV